METMEQLQKINRINSGLNMIERWQYTINTDEFNATFESLAKEFKHVINKNDLMELMEQQVMDWLTRIRYEPVTVDQLHKCGKNLDTIIGIKLGALELMEGLR